MKLRTSNILGIALTDRMAACALVSGGRVQAAARWVFPPETTLTQPAKLGESLAEFLAQRGMSAAKSVVIGVPAKWLISEPHQVPPVARELALASLRMQAERLSPGDDTRMVFDAAGRFDSSGGSSLLVGLAEHRLAGIRTLCAAANLELSSITATGLLVAAMIEKSRSDTSPADRAIIVAEGDGADLVIGSLRGPRGLRHIAAPGAAASSSLRRALTMSGIASDRVTVLAGSATAELCRADGTAEVCDAYESLKHLPSIALLNGQLEQIASEQLWPAVILASAAASDRPVDFLKPKLVAPKESRLDRRWVIGSAVAIAIVAGIVFLWYQATSAEQLRVERETAIDAIATETKAAEAEIERVNFGRTFFEKRPPVLDCLSDLSSFFPPGEPVWLVSFTMRDTGRVTVQGRAADERDVLQLRDSLAGNAAFFGVQLVDLRESAAAAGQRADKTFTLTFSYVGPLVDGGAQ